MEQNDNRSQEVGQGQETTATEPPERDLLRAVLEALDLPMPLNAGAEVEYCRQTAWMAGAVRAAIEAALEDPTYNAPIMARHLRKRRADLPISFEVDGGESR
jgi:hypothetical protein